MAYVPFTEQMRAVVTGRNAEQWQAAINQRASEKGMEPLPTETIELLRTSLLCGDEVSALGAE
jgi:phosphopantetheine adenylyltransferase